MPIDHKLIDNLLKDYKTPEEILGDNGLLKQLTKAVLERAMQAELTQHLGYEKHDAAGDNSGNSRNGKHPCKINFTHFAIQTLENLAKAFDDDELCLK
jgi:transposase-like protein